MFGGATQQTPQTAAAQPMIDLDDMLGGMSQPAPAQPAQPAGGMVDLMDVFGGSSAPAA